MTDLKNFTLCPTGKNPIKLKKQIRTGVRMTLKNAKKKAFDMMV